MKCSASRVPVMSGYSGALAYGTPYYCLQLADRLLPCMLYTRRPYMTVTRYSPSAPTSFATLFLDLHSDSLMPYT